MILNEYMKNFYRKATSEELKHYQQKLYPLQDQIFELASLYEDKVFLTGGTALSRFYFNHRLSDDLDFFTTTNDLKLIANDLIARLLDKSFSVEVDKLDIYFARFFVGDRNYRTKIDFVREFNLYGELVKTKEGIYISNLEDIGANKITAFEDRAEIKDIIDLYFIKKNVSFERLFEIADIKRVPIPYENLLTINVDGISGKVLTIVDIDEKELTNFVAVLKEKTECEIKKKEKLAHINLERIINKILWDFPPEDRGINKYSIPVLKRRLNKLPLPEKNTVAKELTPVH